MTDATYSTTSAAPAPATASRRDIRLDFFRGLAMFIILIAHVPDNRFALWIPARFGFSDATEIFVFCSGMASAIAFGAVYARAGWIMGTARVVFRIWQVYWAHVALFVATASLLVWLTALGVSGRDYVKELNLYPFLTSTDQWSTAENLLGLLTLRYVPNYFDILPMYLVVLAMMPAFVALARVAPWIALAAAAAVWSGAQAGALWLPAEPWTDREWFFNPFGWQLLFFTGFALVMRWLPAPPVHPLLIGGAAAAVLLSIPSAYFRIYEQADWAWRLRLALEPWFGKTDFGPLRYIHFLSLAYLCWAAAGDGGRRLIASGESAAGRAWGVLLAAILKVGQQSLAVFVASMFLAQLIGFGLDLAGRSTATVWLANLAGFALLVAVAHTAAWFKAHPWRKRAA